MSGSCARDRLIHHAMSGSHAAPRVISSKRRRSESTEEACRGGYPPWIVRGQGEQVAAELVVGAILAGPTQACPRNVLRDPDHPATCARCAFCDRDHPKPCGRWFFVIPITPNRAADGFFVIPITPNRAPDGFCDPERVPAVPPQRSVIPSESPPCPLSVSAIRSVLRDPERILNARGERSASSRPPVGAGQFNQVQADGGRGAWGAGSQAGWAGRRGGRGGGVAVRHR